MALDEIEDTGVKHLVGPPPPIWFTWLTRACEFTTFILIAVWVFKDLGGLAFTAVSTGTNATDTSGIFNWHPLLMSLAFPVLMAEAVLAYRAPLGPALERCAWCNCEVYHAFQTLLRGTVVRNLIVPALQLAYTTHNSLPLHTGHSGSNYTQHCTAWPWFALSGQSQLQYQATR